MRHTVCLPMVENESYKATSNERRCSHVMMFLENDFDLNTIFLKNLEYFLEISH